MRDYAINRAIAADSFGVSLVNYYRNWQARRETAKLLKSGDHSLTMGGLTHDDICWALRLPLDQNPRLALEDRAFRRSLA